jgi:hypothetical protein
MSIGGNLTTSGISIGALQTGGNIDIGNNSARNNSGQVNICTATTNAPTITIGSLTSNTALNGTSVAIGTKITSSTYDSSAAGTNMKIGSNLTSGTLTIGGTSQSGDVNIDTTADLSHNLKIGTGARTSITLNGPTVEVITRFLTPICDSSNASTPMTIGSNLVGGSLTIGGAQTADISLGATQTSGDLFIGTGTRTAAADINIGTGANGAGTIYIGHKNAVTSTQAVKINTSSGGSGGATTIGSAGSATIIGGSLAVSGVLTADGGITLPSGDTMTLTGNISGAGNITTTGTGTITSAGLLTANGGVSSTTYDATAVSTAMTLGSNLTSGSLTIGGGLTTGAITLAGAQTTGDINIGTNSLSDIYIGNAASGTGVNTGICHINKLQIASGSVFRSVLFGTVLGGSGSATVPFGQTLPAIPLIVATLNATSINQIFSITIIGSTTGFTYYKNYISFTGTAITASGAATNEDFSWIAIGT